MDFEKNAVTYMKSHLRNMLQRVLVNSSFGSLDEIKGAQPQDSVLGPFLFNIILNCIFSFFTANSNLSSYADDNISYASVQKLEEIKHILLCDFEKVTK